MDRTKKTMEPAYERLLADYEKYVITERQVAAQTWKTIRAVINAFFHRVQDGRLPLSDQTVLNSAPTVLELRYNEFCKTVAKESAGGAASILNAFFKYLLVQGILSEIPDFNLPEGKRNSIPHLLTDEELYSVFELLPINRKDWVEARDRLILHLYYGAECLPSQVFDLTPGSFSDESVRLWSAKERAFKYRKLEPVVIEALGRYLSVVPTVLKTDDLIFRHHRYNGPVSANGHYLSLRLQAAERGIRYSAHLLGMTGAHRRLSDHGKRNEASVPSTWRETWNAPFDFAELQEAFNKTHPRWAR